MDSKLASEFAEEWIRSWNDHNLPRILSHYEDDFELSSPAIAKITGNPAGIATFYDIYSTFIAKPGIWLDDLFVYEDYRKYGVGKALMSKLCSIARDRGCGRIDWIAARDNDNGRGFYHSIGAKIYEEVRHSRLDERAINSLADRL